MNMSTVSETAIIVFVKAPVKGRVKTRLAQVLGDESALETYRCFVADILATLTGLDCDPRIYLHPPEAKPAVRSWLGEDYALFPQKGRTLGDKMRNALAETFAAGFTKAALMGTDIPDLPATVVSEAFEALDRFPAVIGPSTDGGYYLIGFTAEGFAPAVFADIPWSTIGVFARTAERFHSCGIRPYLLPRWADVDTADDLKRLMADCRHDAGRAPTTMTYLTSENMKGAKI